MIEQKVVGDRVVGEIAALMRLLSDPTRLRVLGLLKAGERNVTALCGELDLAQPTVSHHLGLLRDADLLVSRRNGKQIFYGLNPDHLDGRGEGGGLRLTYGPVNLQLSSHFGPGSARLAPRPHPARA